jgi:hypothetical protein
MKHEGKKHECSIGDVRELLKIICVHQDECEWMGSMGPVDALYEEVSRIGKKKAKKWRDE